MRLIERSLIERGVEIETATTDDDGPRQRIARPAVDLVHEEGAARRYFPRQSSFYKMSRPFASWASAHVRDYDIVHVHALFSYLPVVAARAARSAGVPYIIRPLGTLERYGMRERRPMLKRLSLAMVESPLLRDASAVHFTSNSEAEQAKALRIPMRPAIIPLGIERASTLPARDFTEGPLRLLWLSRLDPKKNLGPLLQAVKAVKDGGAVIQLEIAGAGDAAYENEVRAQAQSLGLSDVVKWLGHVEGEAKSAALFRAHVFVLPSQSENFGIAVAEALASGLPCLLTPGVAVASEVAAAGAGWVVEPQTSALAEALRLIISGRPALAEMSQTAGTLAAERYSIDAMGAQLKQLYTEILRR